MPSLPTGLKQLQAAGLDDLGNNDRGDVSFSQTANRLLKMAGTFIGAYENTMRKRGHISSGKGIDLVKVSDLEYKSGIMSVDVLIPEYLRYQNDGVNGTQVNHGSKFSYKGKMPPLMPILKWVRREINKLKTDKYGPVNRAKMGASMRKARAVKQMTDEKKFRSVAFAIAKNIQKKGIKPTGDIDQAANITERIFKREMAEGFKIDIINSLK